MPNPVSFKVQNKRTVPLDCLRLRRKDIITVRASRQGKVSPSAVSNRLPSRKIAAAVWARTKPSAIRVQSVSIVLSNSESPITVRNSGSYLHASGSGHWKHQPENCAAFWPILTFDFTAMLPNDSVTGAESQTYSAADWLRG